MYRNWLIALKNIRKKLQFRFEYRSGHSTTFHIHQLSGILGQRKKIKV